jgi:hypothetical protein
MYYTAFSVLLSINWMCAVLEFIGMFITSLTVRLQRAQPKIASGKHSQRLTGLASSPSIAHSLWCQSELRLWIERAGVQFTLLQSTAFQPDQLFDTRSQASLRLYDTLSLVKISFVAYSSARGVTSSPDPIQRGLLSPLPWWGYYRLQKMWDYIIGRLMLIPLITGRLPSSNISSTCFNCSWSLKMACKNSSPQIQGGIIKIDKDALFEVFIGPSEKS